jgi:hypothetical protein
VDLAALGIAPSFLELDGDLVHPVADPGVGCETGFDQILHSSSHEGVGRDTGRTCEEDDFPTELGRPLDGIVSETGKLAGSACTCRDEFQRQVMRVTRDARNNCVSALDRIEGRLEELGVLPVTPPETEAGSGE